MVCMRLFRTPTSHNAYTEAAAKEDPWKRTLKSGLTPFLLYKKSQRMQSVIDFLEKGATKQTLSRMIEKTASLSNDQHRKENTEPDRLLVDLSGDPMRA